MFKDAEEFEKTAMFESKYGDARAIVGFACYLVGAEFISMEQFIMMMAKVENLRIKHPMWLSKSFVNVLMGLDDT